MRRAVTPGTGWGVLHLVLSLDHARVPELAPSAAKEFAATLERWRERVQLHVFTVLGHKGDVLLMALHDDLTELRALQTDVAAVAAPALRLTDSYLSLTEGSQYTETPEQYRETMAAKGLEGEELERRVEQFAERMAAYTESKLHPRMPEDFELLCFYPMSHRRWGEDNWYALDFEERKRLMGEHGRSGRAYTGRVLQLVTGSTGLDDYEYGVSLFAHDIADIKSIVYTMRYDEASVRYAEFGPFIVGVRRSPEELAAEIGLERTG